MPDNLAVGKSLLSVENLCVSLGNPPIEAVKGISFSVQEGEILAVAGESGSGKSVTALALTKLLPASANPHISGCVRWDSTQENLSTLSERGLRSFRGQRIAYIFQEPSACFNPLFSIEGHFREILRLLGKSTSEQKEATQQALLDVGIEPSRKNLAALPGDFSGGMLQRAAIACALLPYPELLIADEPTTALDASTQKRIVELLGELNQNRGMAIVFISHDLALLNSISHRALIMQEGYIVEEGPTTQLLHNPQHPYSQALVDALPRWEP